MKVALYLALLLIASVRVKSFPIVDPKLADADIVIVGGGPSGCAAAAFLSGLFRSDDKLFKSPPPSIIIVETNSELGGILRGIQTVSGVWSPQTFEDVSELAARINLADPTQNASAFTMSELEGILESSLMAQALLKELGAVDGFQKKSNGLQPDYYGTSQNFTEFSLYHRPQRNFIEKLLSLAATNLVPLLGGVAGENLGRAIPRGEDGLLPIPSFVWRITQYATNLPNVHILFNTKVTGLVPAAIQSSSSQRLWEVEMEGRKIQANHVIFASGGFTANPDVLAERGLDKMVPHHWNEINTGIVEKVASDLDLLPCPQVQRQNLAAWYAEAIQLNKGKTQAVLFLNGDSMMVVNKQGRRVYNEKWPYARRGKVCLDEGYLIVVMDRQNVELRSQALGFLPAEQNVYLPGIDSGAYIQANSPEELASELARRSLVEPGFNETFAAQLDRYNAYAEAGIDEEFDRHNYIKQQEPDDTPNMSPIDKADLFAVVLLPSALDTCSGPAVDQDSHVLYANNSSPVPGVYTVGNAACSLTHGFYLAPGIPTFSAFVQAYRAATSIKAEMEA